MCRRCDLVVAEGDLMRAIKAVLVSDPRCLLWRNEIGSNTHWPDGRRREHPINYGVCNPGGADLIGMFAGRFLAVEVKTPSGRQSPDQVSFERWVTMRGGIYALCRSIDGAQALLERLRGES